MTPTTPPLPQLLATHRSIRSFKPQPIDADLIAEVLGEAVAGGSSSGNLNSFSMVLTQDEARKRRLYELHFEQEMVLQAPLVVTFCADFHRTRRWLARRGARDNFNNLIGWHVAAFDAMIVAQNACLGFEARGLGICYMGTTLHSMQAIADFLELPPTCLPVTSIVVGHPAEDPPKRDRLPLQAFIHHERYQDPADAELDAIYADREVKGWARYMSMPRLKALAEQEGITSLAQFYTSKVKYDPDTFAKDSAALRETLKARGFLQE
ncbi:nitroreductase family protein [Piscinibacterium candidicorallinum]|uniref:Nitroreductase family protein n=1 Tax=Piscinibacterium candidicorallinum TaxID=1793872 RepID=A0ABV7H7Q6_9BURK